VCAAWVIKYKPRSINQVVGNKEVLKKIMDWLRSWEKGLPKKRAAFLYGLPGVGKTVTAEAIAEDLGIELVEKNASDYRTEKAIKHFAGLASQYGSLFGRKRLVLLDELGGITGSADRGAIKATTEIIKTARFPIILTANNAYDPRFSTLRKYCLLLEFRKPTTSDIMKHLRRISSIEGIQVDENVLKYLAQRSAGDIRSAVNDLQATAQGKKRLTYDDVSWLGYRDRQEKIFTVLRMIIYGKTCISAKQALNMADTDLDMLFEWIYENAPRHLSDPHDLAEGMKALSLADLYRGRIQSTQNWGFTRYVVDHMAAGVAMARQNTKVRGWIPFKFPERIRMLSRSKAVRALRLKIGYKINHKCHISARKASEEIIPYLQIIFKNDRNMAAGLTEWLNLDEQMVDYLSGTNIRAK
jgi:replication factor C large subunit